MIPNYSSKEEISLQDRIKKAIRAGIMIGFVIGLLFDLIFLIGTGVIG